jgi:hypothetical protein
MAKEGISVEVIDLRTVRPLDFDTILACKENKQIGYFRRSLAIWFCIFRNYLYGTAKSI